MKHFWKSLLTRSACVVALVLVGVMIYSATSGGFATIPEMLVGTIVTPFQSAAASVTGGISGFFDRLTGNGDLQAELEALRKENAELRQQMVEYDLLKQQNGWYSEILGLHEENSDYTFASGRVIGREPTDVVGNFTISAGTNAGVAVNDPVVTTDGSLIGVVEQVSLTYAKVRTVLDTGTKVSAQISRTGDTGYTAGALMSQAWQNTIQLTTLERSSGVTIGDYVVTSGIGGVYPNGLRIGKVKTVQTAPDGMTLNASVELFADIYDLKQVMVITSFDGQQSQEEEE